MMLMSSLEQSFPTGVPQGRGYRCVWVPRAPRRRGRASVQYLPTDLLYLSCLLGSAPSPNLATLSILHPQMRWKDYHVPWWGQGMSLQPAGAGQDGGYL